MKSIEAATGVSEDSDAERTLAEIERKKRKVMTQRLSLSSLLVLTLFLTLGKSAVASSIWYVDGVHGSDQNNCRTPVTACKTIGHAISLAGSGDTVIVAAATYQENLNIGFSLTVLGSGVGGQTPIIDGGGVNTVLTVPNANAHVTLSNLTIQNGFAGFGGGINNSGTLTISNSTITQNTAHYSGCGGGIYNTGRLIVNLSTISQNSALGSVWRPASGGGICNSGGTATINNSTLSGNHAGVGGGGGISTYGTVTINNSTISGNMTLGTLASAIKAESTTTINNSTISGNTHNFGLGCTIGGSGVTLRNTTISGNVAGSGYVVLCATATLENSIIGNNSGGNCGGGVTSNGYNLSSDGTCNFHNTGDLNNTDPKLGPLQNNGGPTQTEALLDGSPAIDAGNPSGCTDGSGHLLTTDQRGMPRPDHEDTGGCDMGAYERQTD